MSLNRLLCFILVSLYITLASSAPLPDTDFRYVELTQHLISKVNPINVSLSLTSFERRNEYVSSLVERSPYDLVDRDINEDSIFTRDMTSRSLDPVEEQTSVHRTEGAKIPAQSSDKKADKIHANLGKKLDKGMKVLDKIKNPIGGAAGKWLFFEVDNL